MGENVFAPGSKVVSDYLEQADLIEPLKKIGFNIVGMVVQHV